METITIRTRDGFSFWRIRDNTYIVEIDGDASKKHPNLSGKIRIGIIKLNATILDQASVTTIHGEKYSTSRIMVDTGAHNYDIESIFKSSMIFEAESWPDA